MTDIRTILRGATRDLAAGGSPSARLDAEVLLASFLKTDRLQLCTHPERDLTDEETSGFLLLVERRRRGEPVAYITGVKEFWSLLFEVNRDVLIPRPETECLIEEVLEHCRRDDAEALRMIDIGTGSGAIGIALAREMPAARIVATDVSDGALAVARLNAIRHGVVDRMEFLPGDLFAGAAGTFDCVVSNPPYIPDQVYPLLPAGIREFEPRGALIAGLDGTAFHQKIIEEGVSRLRPGGWIFLEIGEGQAALVEALFREGGFYDTIRFRKDYGGIDRVAVARRKT